MNLFELDSAKPFWINLIKLPFNLLAVALWCILGSLAGMVGCFIAGFYHWFLLSSVAIGVVFKKNG